MTLARDLKWTNVRPIDADEEARVLRIFNVMDACFRAPAWAEFAGEPKDIEPVTITCRRCGKPHTYRATVTHGRRKYCNACVRT